MPTFVYKCPRHGAFDRHQRGDASDCPTCGARAPRVWAVPNLIVRPHGFHLRPGEKGYWDIDRALEVGHVPAPDAHSHLGAGAPSDAALEADEYAGVAIPQPTEDGLQKLHEVFRATFSESGSGSRL